MHDKCSVRFGLIVALMTTLPWLAALANTPGTCANACTNTCGAGGTCRIQISRSVLANGMVTATINGTPTAVTTFCVPAGTVVTWIMADADATSFADVRFDKDEYPFSGSTFGIDSQNSIGETASTSGCYVFSVSDCNYLGSQCQSSDPKVVVTGTGIETMGAKNKKARQDSH